MHQSESQRVILKSCCDFMFIKSIFSVLIGESAAVSGQNSAVICFSDKILFRKKLKDDWYFSAFPVRILSEKQSAAKFSNNYVQDICFLTCSQHRSLQNIWILQFFVVYKILFFSWSIGWSIEITQPFLTLIAWVYNLRP